MSFIEDLNLEIIKEIKLLARDKKTGKIYPVKEISFDYNEVIVKREEEYIEEHKASGGHYCSSCGSIFSDKWFKLSDIDLVIEEMTLE